LNGIDVRYHAATMRDDNLALRCRFHARPSPLEQAVPQGSFRFSDVSGETALAGVQVLACLSETGMARNRVDGPHLPDCQERVALEMLRNPRQGGQ
jgi:hypothetical protein